MDAIQLGYLVGGVGIVLVLAFGLLSAVRNRRAVGGMSEEQKLELKQKRREERLFWIPFVILIAIAGGIAGALGTRVGLVDAIIASLLAGLFAKVTRRIIARRMAKAANG